jgi:hypothetical protein
MQGETVNEVAPKVFISHAGEDKPFVREFAKRLRDNGVDAWVDEWEILPGDKLIDKIFEQGIGQCDAFLIVLTQNSVKKPWVVEELDAALVKRIEQQTKIIPIRIHDCEVPVALRATAWIKIDPKSDYDTELHKVLSSIFGVTAKPPIGERPTLFREAYTVGDYSLEETRILEFIVKQQWEKNYDYIDVTQFRDAFSDLPPEVINDAIEVFESDGLVKVHRAMGTAPFTFSFLELRPFGWVQYASYFLDIDTEADIDSVLAFVSSEGAVSGSVISQKLDMEPVRVNMAVDYLESLGYVRCLRTMGCAPYTFTEVEATAQGRRALRS